MDDFELQISCRELWPGLCSLCPGPAGERVQQSLSWKGLSCPKEASVEDSMLEWFVFIFPSREWPQGIGHLQIAKAGMGRRTLAEKRDSLALILKASSRNPNTEFIPLRVSINLRRGKGVLNAPYSNLTDS